MSDDEMIAPVRETNSDDDNSESDEEEHKEDETTPMLFKVLLKDWCDWSNR